MLKDFFEAKKIAVVGAAREREKVGNVIFRNLMKNKLLKVFPVNPNADSIENVRAFPDVLSIPFPVDLAILSVKSEVIPSVLEQCGKKGIKKVIILSVGFNESGNNALTEKVIEIINKYKIKLLGPNVLGVISTYKDFNSTFFTGNLEKGKVSFISQSGAIGTAFLDKASESKLGISSFISLGNMLEQDFISSLEYLEQDRNTEIILLYIESLKQDTGKKFVEICKRISKTKKIIALKAGKSELGEQAAKTHTASLSSDSNIYSGAFKQAGVTEVLSLDELFFLAKLFSSSKIEKNACIITNTGGLGVLAVDALFNARINLEKISDSGLKELDKLLPKGYSRANPLDILGDALAERYQKVLEILNKENIGFYIVIVTPQAMTQGLETAKVISKIKKPVIACFIGGLAFKEAREFLNKEGILMLDDVSRLEWLKNI